MNNKTIPIDVVLNEQFAKIGRMGFQIDVMQKQIEELQEENRRLKEEKDDASNKVCD